MGLDMHGDITDYQNDPHFKNLVDLMVNMIMKMETTPSELRRASMLAAMKVDSMRVAPFSIHIDDERHRP